MSTPALPADARVLDASVWLSAVDTADPHHDASRELIRTGQVIALDLTLYEVANVAVRAWRAPTQALRIVDLILRACTVPPVSVAYDTMRRAISLAREHSITVYDASYVAVARDLRRPLVSCDVRDLVVNGLARLPGE